MAKPDEGTAREASPAQLLEIELHHARRLTDEVSAFLRYPVPGNAARVANACHEYQCAWMNGRQRPLDAGDRQ